MNHNKIHSSPLPAFVSAIAFICLLALNGNLFTVRAQSEADLKRDRNRGIVMLRGIKDYLKADYYDPTFHGVDIETRFKASEEKINQATSLGQIFGIIAQTLVELNDSHTYFVPPPRPVKVDYGWRMQLIGDECYVVAVKPGSDAEAQGLKPGDKVLSVDGFRPNRQNLWKMEYSYNVLRPQPGKRVLIETPDGKQRELPLKAKVEKEPRQVNITELENEFIKDIEDQKKLPVYASLGDDAIIWKLRRFHLSEGKVDDMMKLVRKHKALILDLRGNPGGRVDILERLTGYFFDRPINIAEIKLRKKTEQSKAKPRGDKVFKGQLVVLVDSDSGSAAEVFARIIQIEKRGTVIGDQTSGAVMMSTFRPGLLGDVSSGNMIIYGSSITLADLIMTDGKSLEHVGVTPDEKLLPTAADLAAKRDPVLSRAVSLVGLSLSAEKAGMMFPPELEK
ncbi:MAG TPA: S41 family peptidase [Pyrinomonadaceae bacterium]|jgi:carboxyl-terminal processing protease